MDARIDPFRMFDLALGEAHVIRVGGGRAPDALRSLIASEHVLGTNEIMVVHHTDCGFSKAPSEDAARTEVRASLGGRSVDWMSFMLLKKDLKDSVKDDVQFLRESPYIKKEAAISGWVYDTTKGTIDEVVTEDGNGEKGREPAGQQSWVSEASRIVHQVL
jgi:carbonic anhydrase